jgi:hypothetical protein
MGTLRRGGRRVQGVEEAAAEASWQWLRQGQHQKVHLREVWRQAVGIGVHEGSTRGA